MAVLLPRHVLKTFILPVNNGTGTVDANVVRTNDNLLLTAFNAHDRDTSIHVQSGLYTERPVSATTGTLYTATDKDATYVWTGSAWDQIWTGRRYGAWQDTTTQTTSAANTATVITFNTTDIPDGVTLVDSSKMTTPYPGVYNLQFSSQFVNSDSQLQDVGVWLRKNGTDVVGSNSQFSIPNRHGSIDGHVIAALNYYISMVANDYLQLYWAATSTTVSMKAATASAPYPSTASVIATMAKV